jgi:hypothetical protein
MTPHDQRRSGVSAERRQQKDPKNAALSRDAATANTLPAFLRESPNGVTIAVKVQPRAPRNEVVGAEGGELKIKIAAPPVDSAANEALVEFLANKLDCPRRCVQLLRGQTARHKLVLVTGVSGDDIAARLVS